MEKTAQKIYIKVTEPENRKARIEIDGEIGGWDDDWNPTNRGCDIRRELDAISALDVDEIEVVISSLGGSVDHAFQIYDALKKHKCKITTVVTGLCASGGTIIACAGDTRRISPNSLYLIHKCWGYSVGNANELQKDIDMFNKIDGRLLDIYKSVSSKTEDEVKALLNEQNGNGIWLTAQEALDYGFATEIWEGEEEKNEQARAMRVGIFASVLNKARGIRRPQTVIESVNTDDDNKPKDITAKPGDPVTVVKIDPNTEGSIKIKETNDNSNLSTQTPKEMKKILATYALLGALLAMSAEQEFDETKGITLSADQLGKVESELKALREKAEQLAKAQEENTKAQQELKTAQEKAESDRKAIETLTAERDDFKAKYEGRPATVPAPNGNDTKEGETFDEYVENDPYYKGIQESLGL